MVSRRSWGLMFAGYSSISPVIGMGVILPLYVGALGSILFLKAGSKASAPQVGVLLGQALRYAFLPWALVCLSISCVRAYGGTYLGGQISLSLGSWQWLWWSIMLSGSCLWLYGATGVRGPWAVIVEAMLGLGWLGISMGYLLCVQGWGGLFIALEVIGLLVVLSLGQIHRCFNGSKGIAGLGSALGIFIWVSAFASLGGLGALSWGLGDGLIFDAYPGAAFFSVGGTWVWVVIGALLVKSGLAPFHLWLIAFYRDLGGVVLGVYFLSYYVFMFWVGLWWVGM
jgi:hypothetical protein